MTGSIEAAGMVTRVERDEERLVRGIGLHFRNLGPKQRGLIADYVASAKLDQVKDRSRSTAGETPRPDRGTTAP
jgi:hypothetical protein